MLLFRGLVFVVAFALSLGLIVQTHAENTKEKPRIGARFIVDDILTGPFNPDNLALDYESTQIGITYRGDDVGWPVWSLAIISGCSGTETWCETPVLKARIVSAKEFRKAERPRHAGTSLAFTVAAFMNMGDDLDTAFSKAALDWQFAIIDECPGATQHIKALGDLNWPPSFSPMNEKDEIVVRLHADTVAIVVNGYQSKLSYRAFPEDGTPAKWGNDLMEILTPCLQKSYMTPPWERMDSE